MIPTSAVLALVLQCVPSLHPSPLDPHVKTQSVSLTDARGVVGGALPCVRQISELTVLTIKAEVEKGTLHGLSNAPTLHLAEADLDTIVPGLTGTPGSSFPGASQPAAPPVQPTYESWDVLRQYPRTAPLAQPSTAVQKPQETPKGLKESKDAQGKTTTE